MIGVRDRNARGSIARVPWEENAHALLGRPQGWKDETSARRRSAEAVQDVVKRSGPRYYRAEPKTPRGVPAAKAASASREHTRCEYT
jgi:hypothetical protein